MHMVINIHKIHLNVFCRNGKREHAQWKKVWSSNAAKAEGSYRAYFADQILPYWVQCTIPECGKWRQLCRTTDFTPDLIANFKCGSQAKVIVLNCGHLVLLVLQSQAL